MAGRPDKSPGAVSWQRPHTGYGATTPSDERLASTLFLASYVVDLSELYKQGRSPIQRDVLNFSVERLLNDLLAYEGVANCRELRKAFGDLNHAMQFDALRQCEEGTIPVTIMRCLSFIHQIDFNCDDVPSWAAFSERFGDLLMKEPASPLLCPRQPTGARQ